MKVTNVIVLMLVSVGMTACSHVSPRYSPSATNVEEIKQIFQGSNVKLAEGDFSAVEPGKKSIVCRAAGPVVPADGKTFDQYIKDAIFDEFRVAGVFDAKASKKLGGKLNFIDFSSNIGAGNWTIKMTFFTDASDSFQVENTYNFSTNFIADIACEQVAQAYPAATQDFIKKLVTHPSFKAIVRTN